MTTIEMPPTAAGLVTTERPSAPADQVPKVGRLVDQF